MVSMTWDELGAAALGRQFPSVEGRDPAAVVTTVRLVGPIQSQTARSTFLGLAARLPGVSHRAVTEAFEGHEIVRGSVIRGTVHTCAAAHHAVLDAATRLGQRGLWRRSLGLDDADLAPLWASIEEFAHDEWRTPDELASHLHSWLEARGHTGSTGGGTPTRYLAFGHGGLVRRPRSGGWEGQGAAEYRAASGLLPPPAVTSDDAANDTSTEDLVRLHLAAHGPASRHDLAWWAGLGLTRVDQVLDRLDLAAVPGPDGRDYVDLPAMPRRCDLPGVRLLPEFDALLCAYHPAARARFVAPTHQDVLWNSKNGLVLPPLLVDGRITGHWRSVGSARRRPLEVAWFAGTRRPRKSELDEPVAAVEAALGITVTSVTMSRHTG